MKVRGSWLAPVSIIERQRRADRRADALNAERLRVMDRPGPPAWTDDEITSECGGGMYGANTPSTTRCKADSRIECWLWIGVGNELREGAEIHLHNCKIWQERGGCKTTGLVSWTA